VFLAASISGRCRPQRRVTALPRSAARPPSLGISTRIGDGPPLSAISTTLPGMSKLGAILISPSIDGAATRFGATLWPPTTSRRQVVGITESFSTRIHRGDPFVVVQSRGPASGLSSSRKGSPAARCTASRGLCAHAAPARDVRECSNRSGRRPRASPGVVRGRTAAPFRRRRRRCRASHRSTSA